MRKTTLKEKIYYLQKVFKTPYYFFHYASENNIMVIFENKKGVRYSFGSRTMYTAVEEAIEYAKNEIKVGIFKDPEEKEKVEEDKKIINENDEN